MYLYDGVKDMLESRLPEIAKDMKGRRENSLTSSDWKK